MERLLRSRARGKAEKYAGKVDRQIEKVTQAISQGSEVLISFIPHLGQDEEERTLKVERLNDLYSNNLRDSVEAGNKKALEEFRRMAEEFDPAKQGKFQNKMFDEMQRAKSAIRLFFAKGTEAEKVKQLLEDINLYLTKSRHSASSSKMYRAQYFVGQAAFAMSVDESYQQIRKTLDGIHVMGFRDELVELAANKAKMAVYEEAFDRISDTDNKKGVFAGKEFLDWLSNASVAKYGIRLAPPKIAQKRKDTKQKTTFKGTVKDEWVDTAMGYYKGMQTWAADMLDEATRKNMDGLFNELGTSKSLDVAVELWKTMNILWLKKTDSVEDADRLRLIGTTRNASNDAALISVERECIAKHASRHKDRLLEYAREKGQEVYSQAKLYLDEVDRRIADHGFLNREEEEMWAWLLGLSQSAYENEPNPTPQGAKAHKNKRAPPPIPPFI